MYYYISEGPKVAKEKKWFDNVKTTLVNLGISGEFAIPSPARTIDEIINIGLSRDFSTFAIIGNDNFINQNISSLINQYYKFPKRNIVVGFVPSEENGLIAVNLGFQSSDVACQALAQRFYTKFSIGLVEPNKFFFSPLQIKVSHNAKYIIKTNDYEIEVDTNNISLDSELNLSITSDLSHNLLSKFTALFKNPTMQKNAVSSFNSKNFVISTDQLQPVYRNTEIIAKTPISVLRLRNLLNVIIKRAKIDADKEIKNES
ncbi:MAG: Diacylglycerol kinase catalytic region [Candidatus Berkelbacteria bacterium Licking1014_85]|uniref:Diacylglycerol kinase catalytic region n=1 Tax=Candidatus Berkelbacteria bacterium Licking1014_85 TaxID=2017148 RepID=A0A554LH69_9BACT|nr:MAG: Diacylglycerol kinase catalytic region [Candidatus Berkelbacteria bacterium Licking1014_85]